MKNLVLSDVTNITIVFMVVGDVVKKKKNVWLFGVPVVPSLSNHIW